MITFPSCDASSPAPAPMTASALRLACLRSGRRDARQRRGQDHESGRQTSSPARRAGPSRRSTTPAEAEHRAVLIQSKELTVDDRSYSGDQAATARLSRAQECENVLSPLTGDAPVSADQHSALVAVRHYGGLPRGSKAARPVGGGGQRGQGRPSRASRGAVRQCELQQGAQRHLRVRPGEGGVAVSFRSRC